MPMRNEEDDISTEKLQFQIQVKKKMNPAKRIFNVSKKRKVLQVTTLVFRCKLSIRRQIMFYFLLPHFS